MQRSELRIVRERRAPRKRKHAERGRVRAESGGAFGTSRSLARFERAVGSSSGVRGRDPGKIASGSFLDDRQNRAVDFSCPGPHHFAGLRGLRNPLLSIEADMTTSTSYPHIEKRAGESARLARSPRVRVAQIVMDYLAHGWTVEDICRQHESLRPAEVHAAFAYYYDHQAAIDAEIDAEWREVKGLGEHASPFVRRMRAEGRV